jgi:hypothetical protein
MFSGEALCPAASTDVYQLSAGDTISRGRVRSRPPEKPRSATSE